MRRETGDIAGINAVFPQLIFEAKVNNTRDN